MKVMWTSSSTLSRSKMWRLMVSPSAFFLHTLSELGGGGGGGGEVSQLSVTVSTVACVICTNLSD